MVFFLTIDYKLSRDKKNIGEAIHQKNYSASYLFPFFLFNKYSAVVAIPFCYNPYYVYALA